MATNDHTMDESDRPGSVDDGGNEEFEKLVQAVAHELKQDDEFNAGHRNVISRRGALGALLGLGSGAGLAGMVGNAEAAGESWSSSSGMIGTDSKPLTEANVQNLHSVSVNTDQLSGADIENAASGEVMQSDGDGTLSFGSGGSSGVDVEANGSTVVSGASALNFGTELDATDDGDGSASVSTTADVVTDGDGTDREIWVIANGASDPAGADPADIIFEEQA